MANYNMGTARGRIMIEYDDNGVRRFSQDMENTQRNTGRASSVFNSAANSMGKAGLGIAGGYALAVKSAADFEKTLSAIKAVSGATTADMEKLREKALQLGQDTKFSATEAASAMEELSKAGVSLPDILNGAADAAVALAAAGEVDLKTAAELAANAMNQFALSAKDLPQVADLIAGAANASAIDVGEFGQSLKQVGAVAHLAGLNFKDTAVAIAIMGNAGIKGSDAGTSLKTMLSNLVPHSGKAREVMKELGIITKKTGNRFFDAKGNAKGLADISQVLQDALKGMSKEQKLATLNTLFGSDAIRGAAILTEQGASGFNKMADSMTKIKAADVAKTRMDNLHGSVEQLKGSLDTMLIKLGTGGQGPLRSFVDGLTKAVNWFNNLNDGTRQTIVTITLLVGAFLLLGAGIIKTVLFFQRLAAAMRVIAGLRVVQTVLINLRAVAFVTAGAIRNLAAALLRAAVAGTRAAVAGLRAAAISMGRLAVSAARAAASLLAMAGRALAAAAVSMARLAVSGARAAASMAVVAARATALAAANFASTLAAGAKALALMAVNAARAAASMALMAARVLIVNAAMLAARVATLAWAAAMFLLNVATGPIGLIVIAIVAVIAVIVLVATKTQFFQKLWAVTWSAIQLIISTAVNFIKQHWQLLLAIMLGPLGIIIGLVIKNFDKIKSVVTGAISFVVEFVRNHWRLIIAIMLGPLGVIIGLVTKYWSQIKSFTATVWNAIAAFIRLNVAAIKRIIGGIGSIVGTVAGFFSRMKAAIDSRILSMVRSVQGLRSKIFGVFSGAGSWLYNIGRAIIQGLISGVQSMINHFTGLLRSLTSMIPKVKGPPSTDKKLLVENGRLIMLGLIKGFQDYIPRVLGALGDVTSLLHIEARKTPSVVFGTDTRPFLPAPPPAPFSGGPRPPDDLPERLVDAMQRAGVGAVHLDGQLISNTVGRMQGRETSFKRRTR